MYMLSLAYCLSLRQQTDDITSR